MDPSTYQNPQLPLPDQWIVDQLLARSVGDDITPQPFLEKRHGGDDSGYVSEESDDKGHSTYLHDENHFPHSDLIKREDQTYNRRRRAALRTQVSDTADEEKTHHDADVSTIFRMEALNDTESPVFVPTVFTSLDLHGIENRIPAEVFDYLVTPYVLLTQSLARNPADAVFVTHLILYFTTLVPSAVYLFYNFTWTHAFMHLAFQTSLTGTYKAMMHHHVRDRGVLQPFMEWLDLRFSYILDPLTGFTWNARYLEHIRQQSIKSTAPEDTSRYERDNVLHLTEYTLRFTLLNWFSLSRDFYRTTQYSNAVIAFLSELGTLAFVAQATSFRPLAGLFVLVLPLILTRMIFAIETWGRRAFVDTSEPQSEFKNSITLIDVQSNRHRFNSGYQTSHLLEPGRHWREHPLAFLNTIRRYENENALVFRNIDFNGIIYRLVSKDYNYIAKCMLPIGAQVHMSMDDRVELLRSRTRPLKA